MDCELYDLYGTTCLVTESSILRVDFEILPEDRKECGIHRTSHQDNAGRAASCASSDLVVLSGIQIDHTLEQD